MKLYLAGPMRGYDNYNFHAFFQAAALLRMKGHDVINPAELDINEKKAGWNPVEKKINCAPDFTMEDALRRDFLAMCQDRDSIVLLPGWSDSKGATAELGLARLIGLEEYEYAGDGEVGTSATLLGWETSNSASAV